MIHYAAQGRAMADNFKFGKNYREEFGGGVVAGGRKSYSGGNIIALKVDFTRDLSKVFDQAKLRSIYAIAKAMDEVGNKTKTQVIRSVARQAGVSYGKAKSVIRSQQAMGTGNGEYKIIAQDVTLSLKEFGARQTKLGVSAAPWRKRRVFSHTFVGPNGHVFVRGFGGERRVRRLPIYKLWGPNIPKEMIKDETEQTFHLVSSRLLGPALEKWLAREVAALATK
jgi:hypothetical protein